MSFPILNIANQFIKALTIPFFVLFIIFALVLLYSKRKAFLYLFLVFLFMLLWRLFFIVDSSRYYASSLVLLPCAIVYAIKESKITIPFPETTICAGVVILFAINTANCFSSYSDTYYFDLRNSAMRILRQDNSHVFIPKKDYKRIANGIDEFSGKVLYFTLPPKTYSDFCFFYEKYNYTESDSFFYLPYKYESELHAFKTNNNNQFYTFKEISRHHTNKKRGYYSIFMHPMLNPNLSAILSKADTPKTKDLLEKGILKAYDPMYDTYVFQANRTLIWLIGLKNKIGSEIIYHIDTTSPELLPEKRKKWGFDNRGFSFRPEEKTKRLGNYAVFEKDIPNEYPVKRIRVGINTDKKILWSRFFKIDEL